MMLRELEALAKHYNIRVDVVDTLGNKSGRYDALSKRVAVVLDAQEGRIRGHFLCV